MIPVAYIISRYPTVNHTFVLREVRGLRARGFKIQTIAIRGPDRTRDRLTAEEQEESDATLYVLQSSPSAILGAHLKTFAARPRSYCSGLWMAIRLAGSDLSQIIPHLIAFAEGVVIGDWAIRGGFGHLHTHFSTNATWIAAHVFSLSFSMTIHGPDEFNDVVAFHLAEKIAACRFACAISAFGQSQMMRAVAWSGWSKIDYCYLGVDPDVFAPRPQRSSPEPFQVLTVGRLAAVKGHHFLIDAIGDLRKQGRNVTLCLAGDGPERPALEQHAAAAGLNDSIRFAGALPQPEVRALYQQADCFALASFAEGIPVVLMEAMSMEIPCVATWVNGIPELIEHQVDGLLVPPSDAAALAEEIARLMDHADLRQRLGRAGRVRVTEAFCLAANTSRLGELFERRLGGGPKRAAL